MIFFVKKFDNDEDEDDDDDDNDENNSYNRTLNKSMVNDNDDEDEDETSSNLVSSTPIVTRRSRFVGYRDWTFEKKNNVFLII